MALRRRVRFEVSAVLVDITGLTGGAHVCEVKTRGTRVPEPVLNLVTRLLIEIDILD